MTFRSLLEAVISGSENPESYSNLKGFETLKRNDFKGSDVIANIGDLELIQQGKDVFFLSKDEQYQGYLEVRIEEKVRIAYSHSAMKGGFYVTMFEGILKNSKFKELISDVSVSTSAFKSYQKLNKNKLFNIQVLTPENSYIKFNKKNLLQDEMSRVSITLK